MDKLNQLTALLKRLNNNVNIALITSDELTEVAENIEDFKLDFNKLITMIEKAKNLKGEDNVKRVIAHLYRYLGDIVQDVEHFHELVTIVAQRYGSYLSDEEE